MDYNLHNMKRIEAENRTLLTQNDALAKRNDLLQAMMRGYVNSAKKVAMDAEAFWKEWETRLDGRSSSGG